MSLEEVKQKYFEVKKAVGTCQSNIASLQAKADTLQDALPGLNRAIEQAEKTKQSALDTFAIESNRQTETALKAARQAHETARRTHSEAGELAEATHRALKKQEGELVRLNNVSETVKRQLWQAVFDEIKAGIPVQLFEAAKNLVVIGAQCCMTRQFILDSLFPNATTDEFQKVRSELAEKHGIE